MYRISFPREHAVFFSILLAKFQFWTGLFIKWKWIIRKTFILIVFTLSGPCSHCPPPASFTDRPERAEGSSECPDFVPGRTPNLRILLVAVLAGARPAGSRAPRTIAERKAQGCLLGPCPPRAGCLLLPISAFQ